MQITTSEILGNVYEIDFHSENPSQIINSFSESDFPCNVKLINPINGKSIMFMVNNMDFVTEIGSESHISNMINQIS